jgi:hypothetical protein
LVLFPQVVGAEFHAARPRQLITLLAKRLTFDLDNRGSTAPVADRSRTLFKPTLWAVASWLIFGVAHSLRIDLDMLVATASPARTALKISQLTDGGMPPTYDSMH